MRVMRPHAKTKKMKWKNIYALYRGDKFIDVGTAVELSERTGLKYDTIIFMNSPTYKKRAKANWLIAYKIGKENECL